MPTTHKFYAVSYDEIPIYIHGGWTYGERHAPRQEDDGNWWIGFDCAHSGDLVPGIKSLSQDGVFRDEDFVKNQLVGAIDEMEFDP